MSPGLGLTGTTRARLREVPPPCPGGVTGPALPRPARPSGRTDLAGLYRAVSYRTVPGRAVPYRAGPCPPPALGFPRRSHGRDHPGDGRRRLHRQPLRAGAAAGGLRARGHRQLPQRHPRYRSPVPALCPGWARLQRPSLPSVHPQAPRSSPRASGGCRRSRTGPCSSRSSTSRTGRRSRSSSGR